MMVYAVDERKYIMTGLFRAIQKVLLTVVCLSAIVVIGLSVSAEVAADTQYAIYSLKVEKDTSAKVCLLAEKDCSLMLALYGEHNQLTGLKQYSVTGSGEKQEISFQIAEDELEFYYVKGFLWDLNSCEPLCENSFAFVADENNIWECKEGAYYDSEAGQYVLVEDYSDWDVGAIWFGEELQGDFTLDMDYYTGSTDRALGGGDGMVVAFYADKNYSMEPVLGFGGCKGYGIELDTWSNSNCGDPADNHIALIQNDIVHNNLAIANLPESEDECWHHLKIVVKDKLCKAYVDGKLKLSGEVSSTGYGCLGVVTGSGDAVNLQAVKNIFVSY